MYVIAAVSVVVALGVLVQDDESAASGPIDDIPPDDIPPDVIMPTKSSRPGCEQENLCYMPHRIQVSVGYRVVWENQDAAFHSVTSGSYEEPDGLFDSGHMDPGDIFEYTFEDAGSYVYHCTLHPWMEGIVDVRER